MPFFRSCLAALVAGVLSSHAQDPAPVSGLLQALKSESVEVRRAAIAELQTSLDRRIPEACLPLLKDRGNTVKRLAARAIGSRWHQVPKECVPAFVDALKPLLRERETGVANMAKRGVALLTRDFRGPMVSRSPNERWVLYERYGLPCIIDTRTDTEELRGPLDGPKMFCAYSNEELAPTVHWHPRVELVVMSVIESRRFRTIWVWSPATALLRLTIPDIAAAVSRKPEDFGPGVFADFEAWSGSAMNLTVGYTVRTGDVFEDFEAKLRWDPRAGKLAPLEVKAGR
jgi:hypothetical protein